VATTAFLEPAKGVPSVHTLGVVPYLNALPLLSDLPRDVRQEPADPSVLAERLAAGRYDAALLPVAEALRGLGGGFVGRFGIACDGEVDSVLAFLPRAGPPASWPSRVVLDPASRTSVALLRVLLERRHGLTPRYETAASPGPDPRAYPDAIVLVIGDRAMERRRAFPGGVLDLGAEWKAWTGLPFVFARWTARAGMSDAEKEALGRMLDGAATRGMLRRDELAAEQGPRHGLSPAEARRYLGSSIRYALGERAEAGLARFATELRALEGGLPCST